MFQLKEIYLTLDIKLVTWTTLRLCIFNNKFDNRYFYRLLKKNFANLKIGKTR